MTEPKEPAVWGKRETKPEPERRGGSGRPPGRTRVGTAGGGANYRRGDSISCKIVKAEPGGYAVSIEPGCFDGFLPTSAKHEPGAQVEAQFVCMAVNRMLLTMTQDSQTLPEQKLLHRRGVDLIPPPPEDNDNVREEILEIGCLKDLIKELEDGRYTGCMRAVSELSKSRCALLFYQGRVVTCLYTSTNVDQHPIESSIEMLLNDLKAPHARLIMYELPEEVVLSLSSLQLGYSVERSDDLDAKSYLDYVGSYINQKEQTACIALTLANDECCLLLVHKGRLVGAYYVEQRYYLDDLQAVYDFVSNDRGARITVCILPAELTALPAVLGHSLREMSAAGKT